MTTTLTHDGVRITGVYHTAQAAELYRPGAQLFSVDYDLTPEHRRQLAYWLEQDEGLIDFDAVMAWMHSHIDDLNVVSRVTPTTKLSTLNMEEAYIGGAQGDRSYMPAQEILAEKIHPSDKQPLFRALNHKTFIQVENPYRPSTPELAAKEIDILRRHLAALDSDATYLSGRITELTWDRPEELIVLNDDGTIDEEMSEEFEQNLTAWQEDSKLRSELTHELDRITTRQSELKRRMRQLGWTYTIQTEHTFWSEQPAKNLSGYRRIVVAVFIEAHGSTPAHWKVVYAEERTARAAWVCKFTRQEPGNMKWLRYWHPMVVLDTVFPGDQAGSIEAEQAAVTWADCIRMDETERFTPDAISSLNLELHSPGHGRIASSIIALTDLTDEDDETDDSDS